MQSDLCDLERFLRYVEEQQAELEKQREVVQRKLDELDEEKKRLLTGAQDLRRAIKILKGDE